MIPRRRIREKESVKLREGDLEGERAKGKR